MDDNMFLNYIKYFQSRVYDWLIINYKLVINYQFAVKP